jgi:hypothetical protein
VSMGPDQSESATETTKQAGQIEREKTAAVQPVSSTPAASEYSETSGFDVMALDFVILLAAFFAIAARLNAQPSNSLTPAAVVSATGCGLLITALRKRHTFQRPGLLEAGLGGLILAFFQFIAAITYPNVIITLGLDEGQRLGFIATWGLIAVFSIIFAVVGAALGHLAFAPLRPLPTRPGAPPSSSPAAPSPPARSFLNYLIAVLLLGLAPTLAGFIFSAGFDYMLSFYQLTPGPFPTLRLLSTLLPWQVPIHIDLSGSNQSSIVLLLWRIPVFVGNPALFDLQALEPLVFGGATVSLLLLTTHGRQSDPFEKVGSLNWKTYLALAGALGLFLVLPADLWLLGGLHGLLQVPRLDVIVPISTLHILDPLTFTLNLITGPLVCLAIGALLRQWYRGRTSSN